MKRDILWLLPLLALLLTACGAHPARAEDFTVNIAPADTMGEWVTDWLEGLEPGSGFQYFVYTDPDSWDVYLYYPDRQTEIQALTAADLRLEVQDSVLCFYATSPALAETAADEVWIIHAAAPLLGTWPTEVALYWEVPCEGTYWSM